MVNRGSENEQEIIHADVASAWRFSRVHDSLCAHVYVCVWESAVSSRNCEIKSEKGDTKNEGA